MKRENEALETYKSLHENRIRLAQKEADKINESASARDKFTHDYHVIKDMKARKEMTHARLMEAARNDALATVMKAIYITAMEAEAMTDQGILLAENMVDTWIAERGGASKILNNKVANNTYLLSRITQIVEDAAESAVAEIEEPDNNDVTDEDASKSVQIAQLTAKDAEIKAQIAQLKAEKKAEDEEAAEKNTDDNEESEAVADNDDKADGLESTGDGEVVDGDGKESTEPDKIDDMDAGSDKEEAEADSKEEESDTEVEAPAEEETTDETDSPEAEKAPVEDSSDESTDDTSSEEADDTAGDNSDEDVNPDDEIDVVDDEEKSEDDTPTTDEDVSEEIGEPIEGNDGTDADTTVDGDTENSGKVFDELDKEEDVQKAIEIIRTRVANAEETFIRNNAEDKKKIDELLDKISTNVKTVEDLEKKDPAKAQVAKEAAMENKRKINSIKTEKSFTVFDKMTNILTENIIKNEDARGRYLTEDGQLDVDLAVESAKVMYGFLETLNTIQIEKVDEKYIANIINNMKE